eukprot:6199759-Pleurochrysis_carterae.AAC.2
MPIVQLLRMTPDNPELAELAEGDNGAADHSKFKHQTVNLVGVGVEGVQVPDALNGACPPTRALTHTLTQGHPFAPTRTHAHLRPPTPTYAHPRARVRAHAYARPDARVHAQRCSR